MKAKELVSLTVVELKEKIEGWEEEMFNLRFQSKMGELSNPLRFRIVRRDIARAKTVIASKNRAA